MFKALSKFRSFSICLSYAYILPFVDLCFRLYIAHIFYKSGFLKFKNYINGTWDNTVFLFKDVHPVPGIPAEIAAPLATAGELILPVFLALGLFGRFAALSMVIMTIVMEFAMPSIHNHGLWIMILLSVTIRGPGFLSLDTWFLSRRIRKS